MFLFVPLLVCVHYEGTIISSAIVPVGGWVSLNKHKRYKPVHMSAGLRTKSAYAYFNKTSTEIIADHQKTSLKGHVSSFVRPLRFN